ncbi:MAG: XrtA/PEP-CTERM system TPR-repeat protein PrsT [Candidatus Methylumidiphilus sp.]
MKIFTKVFLLLMLASNGQDIAFAAGDAPLQQARLAMDKGQIKAAVIELKNLLQQSPDNADARALLGEAYLKLGDGASAVKELEKARDLNLPKAQWVASLAQAYLLANQGKTLLEKLPPDPQLSAPVNAKLLALRGIAQLALPDGADKARESFNAALQADANAEDALLGLAMLELGRQQYKPAADYAAQATAKAPKNSQAWLLLGEIKRSAGDLPGALDAFTRAVDLNPNNPKARLGRAATYIATGKLAEARQDADMVIKAAPELPMALYTLGVIEFQSNKLDEAKELLSKVNSRAPDHLPTAYLLGAIAYQKNELEQSEYFLSKVVTMSPDNLPATKLLAATRLKRGNAEEAIKLLKPWAEKEQKDAQLFAILGSAYLKTKQYDQGISYLGKAAELAPDIASVRAELGLGKIAAGKMDQGVDDLKSAVGIDPNLMEVDATIVLAMIQQKKFDEAIAEATKLKAKRKGDPLADNLLGAAYMSKGDVEHARQSWQSALAIKPDYTPANLNLAKLAMSQSKSEEAAKEYDSVLKRDPKNLQALIGLAQVAELGKNYEKMASLLEDAKQKNPKELLPALMLTRYYLSLGNGSQALSIANDAADNNPDNPAALQNLGAAQMGANQVSNAVATFKQLVGKLPDNPEARHQLAQAYFKFGDKAAALKEWDETLKRAPEYVPAMLAKAEFAMQDKRYAEVMKIADTIKAKYPKSPLGYQLEGDTQVAQKQHEKAIQAYDKAYQIAPSSYLARRLSVSRRDLHQDQAALDGLKQWLDKSPQDAEAWGVLASVLQETGKPKEAAAAFEKAYAVHPENLALQNNLAWLYQELGDKRALSFAEKLAQAPGIDNKAEILDTVGWVFLHNGKEDKGLVLLQQATLQESQNPHIRFHLATAFAKTGKKDEAKKELERLLKENTPFPDRQKAVDMLKGL